MTQRDHVLTGRARVALVTVFLLALALLARPVHAGVSPYWQELGGSASGDGISQTPAPKAVFDTSVTVGGDGKPVVAYEEIPDATSTQGPIVVKRWNGSGWDTLSAAVGQGYLPQVRLSASGDLYVAWLVDDVAGNTEIHLRKFDGTSFVELGGSDSSGGISGTNAGITFPFSLAVGADGQPVVAFLAAALTGILDVTAAPAVLDGSPQVYVRHWNGTAWEFLGSDFTGAGASNAVSFESATAGTVQHSADTPTVTVDSTGAPVVAFAYVTQINDTVAPNTDIYVTRWSGTSWDPVGQAVPAGDTAAGRGGPGGVSNSDTGSLNPSIAAGPSGDLALAWEEDSPDGSALYVWVRVWNGSWGELAGSATDSGFTEPFTQNGVPQIAVGSDDRPVVAWVARTPDSSAAQVFVVRWNGTDAWVEPAFHSATEAGISDAALEALAPALALTPAGGPATADVPAVAWLDSRDPASSQVFLRQLFAGTSNTLSVNVSGAGSVSSNPIGLECAAGACAAGFPSGTSVSLIATPDGPATFIGWSAGCSGNASCTVTMDQPQSVTATFSGLVTLSVSVPTGGGRVTSNAGGVDCRDACLVPFVPGTPVTLTATKDAGGTFLGWGGACAPRGVSTTCTLTLATNMSVSASFKRFRVSVAVATPTGMVAQGGVGTVSGDDVACGADNTGTCFADISQGARVVFQAVPQPGNRFLNWSGGPCTGTNATCDFIVTANTSSTALFRGVTGIQVLKAGNGSGTVAGPGIACGADCFEQVFTGTSVTLTPAVTTGTTFRGWSGDVCNGRPSGACTFVAAGNRSTTVLNQSVTATFVLNTQRLTIAQRTNGTVVSDPLPGGGLDCGTSTSTCQGLYDYGTSVVLRATPDTGFAFAGWTGVTCLAGGAANASCAFSLTANVTATPTFRPRTVVTVVKSGSGVGTITGPGIACGTDCSESEFDARLITLTAAPAVGSRFTGWADACAFRGTNTSCAFVPWGDSQTVTATFTAIPQTLTVTPRTNGNVVTVDALPDNIDCGSGGVAKCSATLNYGTLVRLQATPIAGSRFVSWTGCTTMAGTNCSVTLTANRTVTATYRDITTVSLTKTGQGTVTSAPAGISCGLTCTAAHFDFARGTQVRLTPAPPVGWDFIGFSGDCGGTAPCSLNTSATLSFAVAANFSIQLKTLRVTVVGNGSVTGPGGFACDATSTPCAQAFPYGTLETLTPQAAPGFRFTGWSQDCTGAVATTCRPTMTANHSVTATFKQIFGVTVTRQGNAVPGAITSAPAGISCGTDCAEDFLIGTVVTFTRGAPPAGRTFRWLGDCAFRGSNASCALTIDSNKSVIADYSLQRLGLTINATGPGSVTGPAEGPCAALGCVSIVNYGVPVLLQAVPSATTPVGEFVSWSGCTTTSGANCSVTLTANLTVIATFRPIVISLQVQSAGSDESVPLAKGARRQYAAVATFDDGSTQDVTAKTTWSSANQSVMTVVATSGLVTGVGFGNASLTAVYRTSPTGSMAQGSIAVVADTLTPTGVTVSCSPYGQPNGSLSCLPAGRGFEVECSATATFAHGGSADVTDQAVWSSGNAGIARFFGLSDFGNGPIVASFRILTGATFIKATLGSVTSSSNASPVNRWVVQGTPLNVSSVTVMPASIAFTDTTPVPLVATATLQGMTGTAAACTAPSQRDFSLLTTWSVPAHDPVADVNFLGLVTPLASGTTTVHWTYPGPPSFQGDVPISVP